MAVNDKPKATVEPFGGTVTVSFSDAIVASTREALLLREVGHEPVFYIPFRDIYFDFLFESPTEYRCPIKGKARYWNVEAVGEAEEDVMWSYDLPKPEVSAIRQHGAFDPEKVRIDVVPQEDLLHTPHAP
ncbi:DUF427 domain-containing protein [Chelativorans salis]|uniref:DUF427 domain-containing protein n=1 Tax=Chelativorans salis TaxID=2978478 RepID=A0ABT2LI54_9HYPH|nr:DUF427 domain-containing protein [Chelativorans sp. EGI FJ00035]MCT7374246.1 DUF427 domain-containing protein [Chelativorans sp. EGI FJ00035]